jgi:hypothetical protein
MLTSDNMVVPWDILRFIAATEHRTTPYAADPNTPVIAEAGELAAGEDPNHDIVPFMTDVSWTPAHRKRMRDEELDAQRAEEEEAAAPLSTALRLLDFVAYQYSGDQVGEATQAAQFNGCSPKELSLCFGIGKVTNISLDPENPELDMVTVHKWRCASGDPNKWWTEGQTSNTTNWLEDVARTSIFCAGITWGEKKGTSRSTKMLHPDSVKSIGDRPFVPWNREKTKKKGSRTFILVAK